MKAIHQRVQELFRTLKNLTLTLTLSQGQIDWWVGSGWPRSSPEQCTHQLCFKSVELVEVIGRKPPKWWKMNNVGDLWPWRQDGTWLIFELGLEVVQSNAHNNFCSNRLHFVEVIGRKPPNWWKINNVGDHLTLKARSHMADFQTWPRSCPEQCTHQLWFKSVYHYWSYWSETKSVTDGRTERRIHSPTTFFQKGGGQQVSNLSQ